MSNFGFLKDKKEYALFASAAIEAEKVYVCRACYVRRRQQKSSGISRQMGVFG